MPLAMKSDISQSDYDDLSLEYGLYKGVGGGHEGGEGVSIVVDEEW